MSLLIKNGEIVTPSERYVADIFCESETITRIDRNIDNVKADEVIDASGKYVFPGFIDPHVHIYLPFMGTFAKDTHETASRAALVGGTTTFIEMICPARGDKPLEAFELWRGKAEGHSACDFSFHMGVTRYDNEAEEDFREIVRRGIARGVNRCVETLIQDLLLDRTDAEKPNFEGAKNVMSPPLRDKKNQDVLWKALTDGSVATLATDHAPFDFTQKQMGKDDFIKIPNGIPSLEDRINLYFTHGVKVNKIDIQRFVDTASTQAAKLFGLFPRKGAIKVGSDADLVVYEPNYRGKISAKTHQMNLDYNSFEGFEIEGRPHVVTVRGKVAVRDGKFVGEAGRGQYLQREPAHF